MVLAAEAERSIAGPVMVMLLIGFGIIYTFGYLRAVMHRANSDYKKTKAGLPGMRKAFWSAWWSALKTGFWIIVGVALLAVWFGREIHEHPAPAATVAPSSAPAKKAHR